MQQILAEFGTIIAYYHTPDKVFLLGGLTYEVQQFPGDYVFLCGDPQSLGCEQHRTYIGAASEKDWKFTAHARPSPASGRRSQSLSL